jgi:repressor LexA
MKLVLTDRQREILTFIQQFKNETGYPPTLREIGKKFGISSTFGVKRHLDALEKKGYLIIESNSSRAISILNEEKNSQLENQIPVIGRVAAGSPILAIENIEGNIVVDPSFKKNGGESFALKVKGDSMMNAGIFEGDLVIVNQSSTAASGDIVVALINNEATVKTFKQKNDKIFLIPENDKYSIIEIKETDEFSLVGKVVGVIRWFN